jgi:hypothetical protein
MFTMIYPTLSASRGTLVGDILWISTIVYVIAIITGIVG